jgi:hypothetical protein
MIPSAALASFVARRQPREFPTLYRPQEFYFLLSTTWHSFCPDFWTFRGRRFGHQHDYPLGITTEIARWYRPDRRLLPHGCPSTIFCECGADKNGPE